LLTTFIETLFGIALFANAVLFVPQIVRLYKTKDAQGLSLITFIGFCLIQTLTILHGYLAKDYLLITGYIFSLLTCGAVTIMIFYYRYKGCSKKKTI